MDILFLITGFICAAIVPFLNIEFLGFKGTVFYFIMVLFAFFVLAYAILSVFKFHIARIDFLLDKTIISWNIPAENKKQVRFPYYISLTAGLILGTILAVNSVPVITNILLSLACAFVCLGWLIMGIKRLNSKKLSNDNFVLSHMGMIYKDKVTVFNGYSKGIINVKKDDGKLVFSILKNKKEKRFSLDIPDNKTAEVDAFLTDLKDYFNGANSEK